MDQTVRLAELLADRGVDFVDFADVVLGRLTPRQVIEVGPLCQVGFTKAVKASVGGRVCVGTGTAGYSCITHHGGAACGAPASAGGPNLPYLLSFASHCFPVGTR